MKLTVNSAQRYAKMRAHTATHLLHAELGKIFPDTKQAGSLVDSDFLRFDFYTERILTPQEISMLEKKINQIIGLACKVKVEEMSIEAAGLLWAKMFFEEKYGDEVRVVQVENSELPCWSHEKLLSVELCGGTHVGNTKDIGAFTIVSQEAVASGIKRLTALTGPRVLEKVEMQAGILETLATILEVKSIAQLTEKATKIMKDFAQIRCQQEVMQEQLIVSVLLSSEKKSNADFDVILKVASDLNFKAVGVQAKQLFVGKNVLVGTDAGNFLVLAKAGCSAKELAQKVGLKGGGNDIQVQGRDMNVVGML